MEPSAAEATILRLITRAKLFVVLRQQRHVLSDGPQLRRGVARERRISVTDADMRHGRTSRRQRVHGYKRHVLHNLDSGLVRAVGPTPANMPEAQVTDALVDDLTAQQVVLRELCTRQLTPQGRAQLRQRVAVEHTLAHVGHWQGRRARDRGLRKNLFDRRRCPVVHNLHVLQRLPRHQAA